MKKKSQRKRLASEQPVRRRLYVSDQVKPQAYSRARTISNVSKARKFRSDRDKELEKEKRVHRSRMFFAYCLVASLATTLVLTQIYFDATYVSFNDDTDEVIKQPDFDKMTALTREYLSQHPFERISFLMNNDGFEQYLVKQMPEIKEAKLKKANLFSNSLSVSLRRPEARFKNQYVDAQGMIFENNFFSPPELEIIDNSGAGDSSLPGSFLSFIGQVASGLSDAGLVAQKVVIPPGALRYVELYIDGVSYPFKAQIDRVPARQVADIISMKKYLEGKNLIPSYVDVRVEGRGYWR
ncbi:hypothetical protein FWF93_01190 [Candidatus Saccharibacteria bacterium]|nr:hypothetical protein [Candidatus Saccharibacteria bacterium]